MSDIGARPGDEMYVPGEADRVALAEGCGGCREPSGNRVGCGLISRTVDVEAA